MTSTMTPRPWSPPRGRGSTAVRTVSLTETQAAVLTSLCEGKDYAGIGADLGIRPDTTKAHMKAVIKALGARDRLHAAVLAISGRVQVEIRPAPVRGAAVGHYVREDGTLGRVPSYRPRP